MTTPNKKSLNPPLLHLVSIFSIIYFGYYLWWRASETLNPQHPFFSWILWLAEAFGVLAYILFSYFTRNIDPKEPFRPPSDNIKVDIFIPTYNEDEDVLEATLIGCSKILYPHTTYVLDDGNRAWVKELAERFVSKYIARPTHEHAKAGNINYALTKTDGDFIVILDADMVPQPNYLQRTLSYFANEKLALIQLPQEFYNQDSIQHADNETSWHEQSLFFRVIQPGKNYTNSAFWCGSPSVVRRKALEDVGGVATETITEDIHTTVRMHSHGWETLFINEPIAFGIAPQTVKAFLLQRLRWAQGTMQLYRGKESPLWRSGLTWKQRLSYLSSFMAYLEAYQKIVLITIPVLILGFGILPMRVNLGNFMLHWIPYFLLNILANQVGGRGVFHYFKTEKYNILKTIIFMYSTLTLISRKSLKFKVTPKTVEDSVYHQERQSLRGYMVIFGSLVGAMAYAIISIFEPSAVVQQWDVFVIAFFWAGYNAFVIFLALAEVFRKRHERKQYRFPVHESGAIEVTDGDTTMINAKDVDHSTGRIGLFAKIFGNRNRRKQYRYPVNENVEIEVPNGDKGSINAKVIDLSIGGSSLLVDANLPENVEVINLKVSPEGFDEFTLPVERITYRSKRADGKIWIGCMFPENLGSHRERLFEYLFVFQPSRNDQSFYRIFEWNPFRRKH